MMLAIIMAIPVQGTERNGQYALPKMHRTEQLIFDPATLDDWQQKGATWPLFAPLRIISVARYHLELLFLG